MQAPAPALVPKEAPPVISDDEDESCFPESDDVIQMEDEITFHPNIVTPVTLPNAAEREEKRRQFTEDDLLSITTKAQAIWRGRSQRKLFAHRVKLMNERNNLAREILQSEERYVNYLNILERKYLRPMVNAVKSRLILRMEDIRTVFCDFDKSILPVNAALVKLLQQRLENWNNTSKLGDIFLQVAPYFKQYFQYLFNYKAAIEKLQEVRSLNLLHLEEFLAKRRRDPECFGLDLESLLIQPAQRLMRYPLLLENLVKNTWPEHPDYQDLQQALVLVKQVAKIVEVQCGEADRVARVLQIQTSLIDLPADQHIVEPHRRFVREGTFMSVNEFGKIQFKVHCFLFNDMLLYALPLPESFGRPQYKYLGRFDSAVGCDVFEPTDVPIACAIAIEAVQPPHRLIIDMDDDNVKELWLRDGIEMTEYSMVVVQDGIVSADAESVEHQHPISPGISSNDSNPGQVLQVPRQPTRSESAPVLKRLTSRPKSHRLTQLNSVGPHAGHASMQASSVPNLHEGAHEAAAMRVRAPPTIDGIPPDERKLQLKFGLPPEERLVDDFVCLEGRLYLFTTRMILYFNGLGSPMVINMEEITRVRKVRAVSFVPVENSIQIETRRLSRVIPGFWNSTACFDQIKKLVSPYGQCTFD